MKAVIFGAGISGLTAAVNLARNGFSVEVIEKRNRIGGSPTWHPSVHQQTFDVAKTCGYIGIDISACFTPVKRHAFYFYGRNSVIDNPRNSVVCEKGPRPSSVESFLYAKAMDCGVQFFFGQPFDKETVDLKRRDGFRCIVATGLEESPYRLLDIKRTGIQGFRASRIVNEGGVVMSYFGDYTNHDFAYVASSGDLAFALLFSRSGVNEKNLEAFTRHLVESAGVGFSDWQFSSGCVPLETNLTKDGLVLAGTISGMIDPFFLNGISPAMISGKIAALFFMEPERAIREFEWFTRNFAVKRALRFLSITAPFKQFSFPVITYINSRFGPVGVL